MAAVRLYDSRKVARVGLPKRLGITATTLHLLQSYFGGLAANSDFTNRSLPGLSYRELDQQ
jgi:hypothetical protein